MRKINIPLLSALVLTSLAFLAHTFGGDLEVLMLEPEAQTSTNLQQIWTMVRCGWHMISFDLLFASIGIGLVTFTHFFENPKTILQLLTLYFVGYGFCWLITLSISPSFSYSYLKLGQWMLLWTIAALTYFGQRRFEPSTTKG